MKIPHNTFIAICFFFFTWTVVSLIRSKWSIFGMFISNTGRKYFMWDLGFRFRFLDIKDLIANITTILITDVLRNKIGAILSFFLQRNCLADGPLWNCTVVQKSILEELFWTKSCIAYNDVMTFPGKCLRTICAPSLTSVFYRNSCKQWWLHLVNYDKFRQQHNDNGKKCFNAAYVP